MPSKTPANHRVDIARALRHVREEEAKITQSELAARSGLQQQLISRYESDLGGVEPSASTIFDLETAMAVPHGSVLREAGMFDVPDSLNVELALRLDTSLTPVLREVLIATYDIAVRKSTVEGAKPAAQAKSRRKVAAQ